MSLINEALKKAQRQRTETPVTVAPPTAPVAGVGPAAAPRIAKRRPPMPARTQILLLCGGGAVLFMAGVLAFLFLVPDSAPEAASKPPVVARTPTAPPAAPVTTPQPPPVAVEVKLPPVTATVPVAPTTPVTSEAPVTPNSQVPQAPVSPATPTPPILSAPETPVQPGSFGATGNPKVHAFLETLRISGIRASDTDPKVIMNDRVFRLNDIVDRTTQLRLIRVDSGSLLFVDPSGVEYRKNF